MTLFNHRKLISYFRGGRKNTGKDSGKSSARDSGQNSKHPGPMQKLPLKQRYGPMTSKEKIGEGTYGVVFRTDDRQTKQEVAIKKIKIGHERDGVPATALREIACLRELQHPNIVELKEVEMEKDKLWLVFEWVEYDLKKYMDAKGPLLPMDTVMRFSRELLSALHFAHMMGILHRDIKPQNLLISSDGSLKVADFGLARAYNVPVVKYTHEVITLWYRPPEILLGTERYSTAADIWSCAIVIAEMTTPKALFRGDSEIGQLYKIFQTFGTPTQDNWPGVCQYKDYSCEWPRWAAHSLEEVLPNMNPMGRDLVARMTTYEPKNRLSATRALLHPFLAEESPQERPKTL